MYAVIESGGKQHRVIEGETLKLEKIEVPTGETIEFDRVLMVGGAEIKIGTPLVAGGKVSAEVILSGVQAASRGVGAESDHPEGCLDSRGKRGVAKSVTPRTDERVNRGHGLVDGQQLGWRHIGYTDVARVGHTRVGFQVGADVVADANVVVGFFGRLIVAAGKDHRDGRQKGDGLGAHRGRY